MTLFQVLFVPNFLFLESEDPKKDIFLYINSPGGVVSAGLAIYDTIQYIRPDISTVCVGQAASMGSLLLASGTQRKKILFTSCKNYDSSTLRWSSRPSNRY